MALWKEASETKNEPILASRDPATAKQIDAPASQPSSQTAPVRTKERESMESVIAADLTIEGKIEGSGHVRLVGKFKGDVHVEGDLTIEPGAKVTGSVRARTVVIGGELEGNIDAASSVELLKTGVVNGDLKAGSLTVAAGSRMRGQAEFGWDDKELRPTRMKVETVSNP
jgi:cytoskeletal protein CcmA (bactofilin family)